MALFTKAGPARYKSRPFGHNQLVTQYRQVAPAGDATAHDRRDLRDTQSGNDCVVAKNPSKIIFVRKDLVLQRQKDTGRVN